MSQAPVVVKNCRWKDFFKINRLHNRAFDRSQWSMKKMLNRFLRGGLLLKACVGKEIVAYIVLDLDTQSQTSWINIVATDPSYRKRGIAEKLIHICEQSQFMPRFALLVDEANLPAVKLYEKLGYQISQLKPGYYPNGHNGIEMHKMIANS